jgi:hypothetical protein
MLRALVLGSWLGISWEGIAILSLGVIVLSFDGLAFAFPSFVITWRFCHLAGGD